MQVVFFSIYFCINPTFKKKKKKKRKINKNIQIVDYILKSSKPITLRLLHDLCSLHSLASLVFVALDDIRNIVGDLMEPR